MEHLESRLTPPLCEGTTLGDVYRVVSVVSAGAMASVYRARHLDGRVVAVKVLRRGARGAGEDAAVMRSEVFLSHRVAHPAVVPIIDEGTTADGEPFFVMPFLEGETLHARWVRCGRRLGVAEVVRAVRALLSALAHVHAGGVVHLDVKPENLFLTRDGAVRLLDFGVARIIGRATPAGDSPVVGTPAFMAPEHAAGRLDLVDARSDLWSVGATMFALLSGHIVHGLGAPEEIAARAATRPARSLATVAPHIPASVCAVVDRALRFRPRERWSDAAAMEHALRDALERVSPDANAPEPLGAIDDSIAPHDGKTVPLAFPPARLVKRVAVCSAIGAAIAFLAVAGQKLTSAKRGALQDAFAYATFSAHASGRISPVRAAEGQSNE